MTPRDVEYWLRVWSYCIRRAHLLETTAEHQFARFLVAARKRQRNQARGDCGARRHRRFVGENAVVDLPTALNEAERKAWDALARYKFWMFGYYAGRWVFLNRLIGGRSPRGNPFKPLVAIARDQRAQT